MLISYLQGRLDWTQDQCMAPRENIDLTWREGERAKRNVGLSKPAHLTFSRYVESQTNEINYTALGKAITTQPVGTTAGGD